MYKVLIAEDEILVRIGLANSIPWKKLNMTLVAQATNGEQALEMFMKERPQILITDIRMPLMDGMELIRRVREVDSACKIIIITCVEEFAYARQAIAYQVSDYILKLTMKLDEIEALLLSIRNTLDQSALSGQVAAFMPSEEEGRREELYDFLCGHGGVPSHREAAAVFSGQYYIAILRFLLLENDSSPMSENPEGRGFCRDKSLYQLLMRQLEHEGAVLIEKMPGEYYLVFHQMEKFREDMEGVKVLAGNYFNSRPICGVSLPAYSMEEAGSAVRSGQEALKQYFFFPACTIFEPQTETPIPQTFLPKRVEEILLSFSGAYPRMKEFCMELSPRIQSFFTDASTNAEEVKKLFYYLADWFLEELLLNSQQANNCIYNYRRYVFEAGNIRDIYFIFERMLNKLLSLSKQQPLSREMIEITRYIGVHYAENINLNDLAEHVNLSKGYLCNLFRKELNTSYGSYLNDIRIFQAKKLLTTSFLRLYEIGDKTGFYDYSHFVRTFKKATGMTPQEYQNSTTHQGAEVDSRDE